MALDINGYNDAFRAFVNFAETAKTQSTFAQIGGEKNAVSDTGALAGRTIVAKTSFDFCGNVGRRRPRRRNPHPGHARLRLHQCIGVTATS